MSSPVKSPGRAAMHQAYEAPFELFPTNASPEAPLVPAVATEKPGLATTGLAPQGALATDQVKSPLTSSPAVAASIAAVPHIPASISLPAQAAAPLTTHEPAVDPALEDTPLPVPVQSQLPAMPPHMPRAVMPFMHQLDVSVQGDYSAPASVSSESPETPNALNFGFYSNVGDKGSLDDLSRPQSMTDLSVYGATKGTVTSASSESGVGDDHEEGGVPAPKAKKSHARKQPAGHIKRARNAFILFRKHITDSGLIPASVESKHQNISVVAAKMWREAPQDVRHKFQEEARLEKEEHQRKYPGYRYQPVFRRTDIIRRRVRKDKTEDEKVEAVAEAMMKGKAGSALAEEVKEQVAKSAAASESESEAAPKRRRRREDGELSKGALRAQKAQNRAKAMRQNLLGSSLLGGMLYNQGHQQQGPPHPAARPAGPGMAQHPGAQYHLAQHPGEYAMPVGYDVDGRPILRSYASGGYETALHPHLQHPSADMYRLPPIQDAVGGPNMWDSHDINQYPPSRMDHWLGHEQDQLAHGAAAHPSDHTPEEQLHPHGSYFEGAHQYYPAYDDEYRFPPLIDGSTAPRSAVPAHDMSGLYDSQTAGAAAAAAAAVTMPDAPSGHVIFNERLFDGALGSAPLAGRRDLDEGLGAFDEAVAQANESPAW